MEFDPKQDFKEKNMTISVKNTKEVFDIDGNMLHESKASLYIKGFVKYPQKTEKMVKLTGAISNFLFNLRPALTLYKGSGAFLIATGVGAAANIAASMLNLQSLTGAMIGMFEVLQYMSFLMLLNTDLPPACDDFISKMYENTIELGAILNKFIIGFNFKNVNFAFNYDLDVSYQNKLFQNLLMIQQTPPKFQKEEIRYMLLLNASIPCLLILAMILLLTFYRLTLCLCGCCSRNIREIVKKKIRSLE